MKLTRKTSYGVQALFDMAFHGQGRPVQAKEVASRQGIPLRYLEQILQDLRHAGLVEAKRGPRGGYSLARLPETVRLDEIVAALDGPVSSLFAFEESGNDPVVTGRMWRDLGRDVAQIFAGVTLKALVDRAETQGVSRSAPAPQMYFI